MTTGLDTVVRRSSGRLPWLVLAGILVALFTALGFLVVNRSTLAYSAPADVVNPYLATVGYGLVGAIIAANRPRHPVGWLLMAVAAVYAIPAAAMEIAIWRARAGEPVPLLGVLQGNLMATAHITLFTSIAIFFPQGHLPRPRWRFALAALAVMFVVAAGTEVFAVATPRFRDPGVAYRIEDPGDSTLTAGDVVSGDDFRAANASLLVVDGTPARGLEWISPPVVSIDSGSAQKIYDIQGLVWTLALFPVMGAAALRIVWLGFRGRGVVRLQVKWVSYAVLVAVALVLASTLPFPYAGGLNLWAIVVLALGVPVAIAAAVTRYRLYDIDRLINRTVVYALVVGLLAALFAAGSVGLPSLLWSGSSEAAVAGTTLAVFFLFQPLRRRVQRLVDRRFDRTRYDAEEVAEQLADRIRRRVRPEALGEEWVAAAVRTMTPSRAGVWLKESP